MGLRRRNKVNAAFSMSSMTDIVFLLLIFFMVTSTLVHPTALKLLMPGKSNKTVLDKKITTVTIASGGTYIVNGSRVSDEDLENSLQSAVEKSGSDYVSMKTAKNVTTKQAVVVMDIAQRRGFKVVLNMQ